MPPGYGVSMKLKAEFTTEPFSEEETPAHALCARDTALTAGLQVDFGPLGTAVSGESEPLFDSLGPIARAAFEAGATTMTLRLQQQDV